MITLNFGFVDGLTEREAEQLLELSEAFNFHQSKNITKDEYYEGHISLRQVNIGIAIPENVKNLQVGCNWGQKAVDVLASRSMFDGFVSNSGDSEAIADLIAKNKLVAEYAKACRDELKYGCVFATLSKDDSIGCNIRFHSPQTAAALWNGEKGRIDCGLAIIDTMPDEKDRATWHPSIVNMYTDDAVVVLECAQPNGKWIATRYEHKMGRPLMEAMIWNATSNKPFGRSRLKKAIRALIDDFVRIIANATIALEFSTTPQKYILGLTDEQYEATISNKFKQYAGAILASTINPETGNNPSMGQFSQGSLAPHIDKMRMVATQFAAATGLSVVDVGIINDANPTSSDAILAQSQTLVLMAQQLNTSNGESLKTIMQMAQAVARNVSLNELTPEESDIMAHFKNPAMPSVAVTADAAIKIASVRPEFASTDTFLEMVGFDRADVLRIKSQEQRVRGQQLLTELEAAPDVEAAEEDDADFEE